MPLNLNAPVYLKTHFEIIGDHTIWCTGKYNSNRGQNTPDRCRATFQTWQNALLPKTCYGKELACTYGIYILAFDIPCCHLYVGIAAFGGNKPEGILSRIKKHRVKATGSHVGATKTSCGGVNHTYGWRQFAGLRAQHFFKSGTLDILDDSRLIVGQIFNPENNLSNKDQCKHALEAYESTIVKNESILIKIKQKLWPDKSCEHGLITMRVKSRGNDDKNEIVFWEQL